MRPTLYAYTGARDAQSSEALTQGGGGGGGGSRSGGGEEGGGARGDELISSGLALVLGEAKKETDASEEVLSLLALLVLKYRY
jgi:hypothetical protein